MFATTFMSKAILEIKNVFFLLLQLAVGSFRAGEVIKIPLFTVFVEPCQKGQYWHFIPANVR
jgi:hypothetical protein